jgi:predicted Ser/Thr protein kinase
MGVVYKARQKELDRSVALKILSPAAEGPDFAERFTREARALAKLSHPGIVAIYDFGQTDGIYWVTMEYVDGVNLRQLIRDKRLSPREAVAIVPQLCEALQCAHDEGIVHRDIKPENILLDRKGRVKIADFGLAKILGHQPADLALTGAGDKVGTPHYMAPEQIESSQEVDNRADIYSLGVVFYEMLTGELPLGRFSPPSRKVQIDVRLDEVVLRALEKEPEMRFQQASSIGTEVQTILSTPEAPVAKRRERGTTATTVLKRGLLLLAVILMLLLALVPVSRFFSFQWPFEGRPVPGYSEQNLFGLDYAGEDPVEVLTRVVRMHDGTAKLAENPNITPYILSLKIVEGSDPRFPKAAQLELFPQYAEGVDSLGRFHVGQELTLVYSRRDGALRGIREIVPFNGLLQSARQEDRQGALPPGNDVGLEIIALCPNPREAGVWYHPDGIRMARPPVEIVKLGSRVPVAGSEAAVAPEDEILLCYQFCTGEGEWVTRAQDQLVPAPSVFYHSPDTVVRRVSDGKRMRTLMYFAMSQPADTIRMTSDVVLSDAKWEPLAVYNRVRTSVLREGIDVDFSPPRFDEKAKRYVMDVRHNIPRTDHALRGILRKTVGDRGAHIPTADRNRVGVRLPGRQRGKLLFRGR